MLISGVTELQIPFSSVTLRGLDDRGSILRGARDFSDRLQGPPSLLFQLLPHISDIYFNIIGCSLDLTVYHLNASILHLLLNENK